MDKDKGKTNKNEILKIFKNFTQNKKIEKTLRFELTSCIVLG